MNSTLFPHKTLPKVYGEPTFKSIFDTHILLKQNASQVPSTLGGGGHGLLPLIMPHTEYVALTGAVWIEPPHPGPPPQIVADTTAVESKNNSSLYHHNLEEWTTVNNTRTALQQQILETFDADYLIGLRDPQLGWLNITPLAMIEYLYEHFGDISPEDIVQMKFQLNDKYDPTTPIHQYFTKLDDIRTFADKGHAPIGDADIVSSAYVTLKNTGEYDKPIDEWEDKPTVGKTWANFKSFFIKAYNRYKRKQKANLANAMPIVAHLDQHLLNLAEVTTVDREKLANLASANAALTNSNTMLTKQLNDTFNTMTSLQKEMSDMKRDIASLKNKQHPSSDNSNRVTDRKYYCWTHGLTNDPNHISGNCKHPNKGHRDYASFTRKFGGSEKGC